MAPHPTKPNWSTVYYSADLAMKGYVPGFIMSILTGTALKSAVTWVKRESEAEWAAEEKAHAAKAAAGPRLPFGGPGGFGAGARGAPGRFKLPSFGAAPPLPPPPPPPPPPMPVPLFKRPKVLLVAGITAGIAGAAAATSMASSMGRTNPSDGAK